MVDCQEEQPSNLSITSPEQDRGEHKKSHTGRLVLYGF